MKSLEQIKNEYAQEKGWTKWHDNWGYTSNDVEEIARRFASEVLEEARVRVLDVTLKYSQQNQEIIKEIHNLREIKTV